MLNFYLSTPQESIIYRFGVSLRFVVVSILFWAFFLGGLSYFFQIFLEEPFFARLPLVLLGILTVLYISYYLMTDYFVSDLKIYKKIGIGFAQVTSVKHTEVDDMKVFQGLLEKIFFGTGTLKFNTPGSDRFELILPRVGAPYEIRKEIYKAWQK